MSPVRRIDRWPCALVGLTLAFALSACSSTTPDVPAAASIPPPETLSGSVATPPAWRVGDRWTFELTSGTDSVARTIEILEARTVRGVPYYIARSGDLEVYYTHDLQWAFAVRNSKVQSRMVPPQPWFVWPLDAGRRWTHRGSFEDSRGKKPFVDTFRAVGVETVEVPAGRFQAMKVVREGERGDSDEYWYVPSVRWYVRWVGRRGKIQFEERLRNYDPAPRPSSRSPSGSADHAGVPAPPPKLR